MQLLSYDCHPVKGLFVLILNKVSDLEHCTGVFSVSYRLKGAEIHILASSTRSDSANSWLSPAGELANTSVQT